MADFSDIVEELKKTNSKLDDLTKAADPKGAAAAEDKRDAANASARSESYLKTIADAVSGGGGKGDGSDPKDKTKGGLLAGIGGALGGMGIGAGVAMGGLGALFAGGGYLLKQIAEFDGKAVVENVKHLMSIGKLFDGPWDAFKEGGAFFVVMTGLGAGLIAFSAGAGVAAAVSYFTKKTTWAKDVYDNVKKLISIKDIAGYDTFKVAKFSNTMGGISAGLIKFAVGEFITGVSQKFTTGMAWTQSIYNNVEKLISIQNITGYDSFKSEKFSTTMGGISAGLVKFAVGEAAIAAAKKFSEGMAWTQAIYDNVKKLISIQEITGYDSFDATKFSTTMGGISAGLIKFAVAEFISGTSQKFTTGMAWSQSIYDNVKKLISIQEITGYDSFDATKFSNTMGGISAGLIKFSVAEFISGVSQKFTTGMAWTQSIYDNVKKLVSIQNITGYDTFKSEKFSSTMGGISAGLIKFAIAEVMSGLAAKFTSGMAWTQTIYDNVKKLISIQEITGYDTFDSEKFSATMGGITGGLIKFAIAGVMTGIAKKFMDGVTWTQTIYDNVKKLISIQKITGYDTFKAEKFKETMGGITLGLIAFAIAKVMTGIAKKFIDGVTWTQTIYDNVAKIISIQKITGYDTFKSGKFAKTMAGIALGLIAFAIGSATIKDDNASKMDKSLTQFTKTGTWAQSIYDNVATLISIMTIPNIKKGTDDFVKVMGGIALGLVAFAIGKGASGTAEAINKFAGIGQKGGKSFAQKIKDEVATLLGMLNDDNIDIKKSNDFNTILENIAKGLAKFGAGGFVSSLGAAAGAVLDFLRGGDSPVQEIMKLAAKSEELTKGADAISKIGDGLDKMAGLKFDGGKIRIDKFAKDLIKSVPLIEAAIMGGTIEGGLLPFTADDKVYKGLASKDIKWEDASKNIKTLREALGVQVVTDMGGAGGGAGKQQAFKLTKVNRLTVNTLIAEKLISRAVEKSAAGQGGNLAVNNTDQSVKTDARQTNMTIAAIPYEHPSPIVAKLAAAGVG